METAFVTGVAGFVGGHLCAHLLEQGCRVHGSDTLEGWTREGVTYHQVDILDEAALKRVLRDVGPSRIYHLAGISYPPEAAASPRRSLDINIMGCVSLLDAVRESCPRASTLVVGSSKVYGNVDDAAPVTEDAAIAPRDFYGISKCAAELIAGEYTRRTDLDVRMTRSFNHTGPGQSSRFVCSDWARQVALADTGKGEPRLMVGDVSGAIDFSDVRDVARAYHAILTAGSRGAVYNVCSGRAVPLEHILQHLCGKAHLPIRVERDERRVRGHTTRHVLTGDSSRLRRETAWKPRIPFEQTLDDLFEYWKTQCADTNG